MLSQHGFVPGSPKLQNVCMYMCAWVIVCMDVNMCMCMCVYSVCYVLTCIYAPTLANETCALKERLYKCSYKSACHAAGINVCQSA